MCYNIFGDDMEDLKFKNLDIVKDKAEINSWETVFKGTHGWNRIYRFILENGLIRSLNELIETNYERIAIGENEVKLAFVIKNGEKETIGFCICQEFDIPTNNPQLFVQYIVIRPDSQKKGYGTQIFKQLPSEVEKFTGTYPKSCFGYVDKDNSASLNMLKKQGVNFQSATEKFEKMSCTLNKKNEKSLE